MPFQVTFIGLLCWTPWPHNLQKEKLFESLWPLRNNFCAKPLGDGKKRRAFLEHNTICLTLCDFEDDVINR